jgi:hypothetical protein
MLIAIETGVCPGRLSPSDLGPAHTGRPGADFHLCQKLVHGGIFTFRMDFDGTIGAITHKAGDSEPAGCSLHKKTEAHTLNKTGYENVRCGFHNPDFLNIQRN